MRGLCTVLSRDEIRLWCRTRRAAVVRRSVEVAHTAEHPELPLVIATLALCPVFFLRASGQSHHPCSYFSPGPWEFCPRQPLNKVCVQYRGLFEWRPFSIRSENPLTGQRGGRLERRIHVEARGGVHRRCLNQSVSASAMRTPSRYSMNNLTTRSWKSPPMPMTPPSRRSAASSLTT